MRTALLDYTDGDVTCEALHAFTAPGANMPDKGILYNADAARRAWIATETFLKEIFD